MYELKVITDALVIFFPDFKMTINDNKMELHDNKMKMDDNKMMNMTIP